MVPRGRLTPTSAVRATSGWVLKTPSQQTVKRVVSAEGDPVRFPAAEPDSAAVVEVAQVAHAMIERVPLGIGDLGQRGGVGATEILSSDDRARDDDLADGSHGHFKRWRPERDRLIADLR